MADVAHINDEGGTILGSSRTNPIKIENGVARIEENLKKLNVEALVAIGGEDTLGVATQLHKHNFKVIGVPKTIDNDLLETDHCPGYGSAARFVAHAFQGDDADNRSLKGIKINVLMGRHAGWLTAASTLGKST